jgi:hypothetical protein
MLQHDKSCFWHEDLLAKVGCKFFLNAVPENEVHKGSGRHLDFDDQFIVWAFSYSETLLQQG